MSASAARAFDDLNRRIIACEHCPRLRSWCREVAIAKRAAFREEDYWGQPVPNFGSPTARVLVVGLAPGAHGANRTGRVFTGDASGDWLFRALHRAGFASQPDAKSIDDGLHLTDCAITNVCHCAPPVNKLRPDEIEACQPWLDELFHRLPVTVLVALGKVAWDACWKLHLRRLNATGTKQIRSSCLQKPRFAHAAEVELRPGLTLIGSFHPSRQNTNTGRLTEFMFDRVFQTVRKKLV